MDLSTLNKYSAEVARAVFAAYPHWAIHASAENGILVIRVPCTIEGRPGLMIYTDDDEISVDYDRWHGHFDDWTECAPDHLFDDAYACTHAIVSEHVAVAVRMNGNAWAGSELVVAGELP
jgi:hypothetical protein